MLWIREKERKIRRYHQLLGDLRWKNIRPVENILCCAADYKKDNTPPPEDRFTPLAPDGVWGSGNDSHAWFRFSLPAVDQNTYLHIKTDREGWDADNPQFLLYVNGEIRQGFDTNHRDFLLDAGELAEICLYAYTGPRVASAKLFADLRELDAQTDGLYYDILYPMEMLNYLDGESDEYAKITDYLYRAVSLLELYEPGSADFTGSVGAARAYLATEFYGRYCAPQKTTTVCIGHTHIDCAWKWTLRQTREKVQRSFGTVLELMRRYPEYRFMSSQALLYQNLEEEAPDLFEQVRARVREGRWECEGAMWVEPDCNLPSGESLVRQLLYGKRYFKERFGVDCRVLWLPDVFGYSAALPQILRRSGVDWFVTSKISWNDVNRMPCDTFLWQGIDGTAINSYFLTAQKDKGAPSGARTTYNGDTNAPMIAGTYRRYSQKDLTDEVLLTFGYGDGGGGPTREQLELARRGAFGVPGSPNVKIGFAGEFLSRLERRIAGNRNLPRWQGELYLEFHRGTYTSQARNKNNNRRAEFLFAKAELLSVLGQKLFALSFPREQLHRGWEKILTNQFHDIIPGSSIREVYEDSDRDYREIMEIGQNAVHRVETALGESVSPQDGYLIFNPTSFETQGFVRVDGVTAKTARKIAPLGYTVTKDLIFENHVRIEGQTVENECIRVRFDDNWQIVSLYDKRACREVLTPGGIGNQLRVYADYPDTYDAWEWQSYSREEFRAVDTVSDVTVIGDGARRGIRVSRAFGRSTLVQTMWFYDGLARVDFETDVDWHERHQMLKAAFPVDITADTATYEIQFGTVQRPTHFNTSWDYARFEVCGHKYADLSDGGYGVSLLNDSKYGYDIHDSLMQLSLLRSPTSPDPEADQGRHHFTYAVNLHEGALRESDTACAAYLLNNPMTLIPAAGDITAVPLALSLVTTDRDNVICETVKEAEDGTGTILRMYENANIRGNVTVTLGFPAEKVWLCDLMEKEEREIPLENGRFTVPVRGFEILTFKAL